MRDPKMQNVLPNVELESCKILCKIMNLATISVGCVCTIDEANQSVEPFVTCLHHFVTDLVNIMTDRSTLGGPSLAKCTNCITI